MKSANVMTEQGQDGDSSAAHHRAEGDAKRDAACWPEAAQAYQAYLDIYPDDTAIRIQFGHCLKEQGQIAAALAQYQQALMATPEDDDLHLQIGHALKLLGRLDEAKQNYEQALLLRPDNTDARHELNALAQNLENTRKPCIVFDISDLIQYLHERRLPTGIQRVQLNIIQRALTQHTTVADFALVYLDRDAQDWVLLTADFFLALYDFFRSTKFMAAADFDLVIDELQRHAAQPKRLEDYSRDNGFILFNLGTPWWIENYFLHIRALKQRHAIRFVSMLYDCIPIVTPEHCATPLVAEFAQWFATMALESDAVVTISEWSVLDASAQIASFLPDADLPMTPVPLNGDMRRDLALLSQQDKDAGVSPIPPGTPFILCVGTLESRKNHLMLFQAWQAMIERHGAEAIPALVCIGKPGWLFGPAKAYLQQHPALTQKIHLISGLADAGLAELYETCLFTVFNSFYEGWGLPVTESLSYGKLALVACNSSLTEAGGKAAVYFRTGDIEDLIDKLEVLIFQPEERLALQEAARAHTQLRDWGAIADAFLTAVLQAEPTAEARQKRLISLELGRILHLGKGLSPKPSLDLALADMLRLGRQWHRLEDWGCWTAPGIASLRLPLPQAALGRGLRLYVRLRGSAFDTPIRVTLRDPNGPLSESGAILIGEGTRRTLLLEIHTAAHELQLDIDAGSGSSLGPGDRDVGIGVTDIMLCARDDLAAQQRFAATFGETRAGFAEALDRFCHKIEMRPA